MTWNRVAHPTGGSPRRVLHGMQAILREGYGPHAWHGARAPAMACMAYVYTWSAALGVPRAAMRGVVTMGFPPDWALTG